LEQAKNKNIIDRIWDFFASVKLAIIIFAFIALTSIVGTILEQHAEPARNIQILTKIFGESLAPHLYNFFEKLGFMDMYRSWWFISLLILFATNVVICSIDRLPRIWRLVREPMSPLAADKLRKFNIHRETVLKGKPEKVKDTVASALKHIGFRSQESKEENGFQFVSQKGNYSRLGVYITHFSILIILIGAIIGIFFGFKGQLNLPEGSVSNVAFKGINEKLPLGFEIRCDNFDTEFYGRSDMPKEYKSWLTILKDGKEVLTKSISVNDPLTYEGITFYQSNYGFIPERVRMGLFIIRVVSRDGKASDLKLRLGDTFEIPGTDISGKLIDFSPALRLDNFTTYSNQMNNPAVLVEFSESGKHKFSGWILRRHPETWQLPEGSRVEFIDLWGVEFTGLQVRKDPGVWIVYLGCITISIGLFIAFFMSHRKVWASVVEDKNNARIVVGATANKNRAALERKIDRMISLIKKDQEGKK
jgi:cytochrome c biogenesis protein